MQVWQREGDGGGGRLLRGDVIPVTMFVVCRSGSVKVTVEVVGSPEVSRQDVQRKLSRLTSQQVRFDGMMRLFARAELVVHGGCHVVPSRSVVRFSSRQ